jgi:anti-sigma regulatory factor (Ser/Thr protein kinase)
VLNVSSNGTGHAAAPSTSFELPGTPEAALAARRELIAANGSLSAGVRDDVLLLVTELVTNAVRHGSAGPDRPVRVELGIHPELVRVAVFDHGRGFRKPAASPNPDADGRWGLFLVDQLADRWGFEATGAGLCVWFEIGTAA